MAKFDPVGLTLETIDIPKKRQAPKPKPLVPPVVVQSVALSDMNDEHEYERQSEVYRLWTEQDKSIEQIRNIILSYHDEYLPDNAPYTNVNARSDLSAALRARLRGDQKEMSKHYVHIELDKLDEAEARQQRLLDQVNARLMMLIPTIGSIDRDAQNEVKLLWTMYSSLDASINRAMERRSKYLALDTAPTPVVPQVQQNNVALSVEDFTKYRDSLQQAQLLPSNQVDNLGLDVKPNLVDVIDGDIEV